jgi:hypothetical protein
VVYKLKCETKYIFKEEDNLNEFSAQVHKQKNPDPHYGLRNLNIYMIREREREHTNLHGS